MRRLIASLAVFCTLARSQVPYNVVTQAPGTVTYNAAGRNPVLPGYNYPYYSSPGAAVPIVSYLDYRDIDGSYSYSYASADGKEVEETGFVKDAYVDNAGNTQSTQVKKGGFAYTSPEGIPIQVNYVADELGFRPAGIRIPADGKTAVPSLINGGGKDGNQFFNKYSPFNNRYSNYGPYNGYQPYDPRYPYDPTKYSSYNLYRPFRYEEKAVQETNKKGTV